MQTLALDLAGLVLERQSPEMTLRLIVDRFSLRIGEAVALCGPSGAGKSSMLDLLSMLLWPKVVERYRVLLPDGRPYDATQILRDRRRSAAARLRAASFGYVLQTGGLHPFLTVRHNMLVADPLGLRSRSYLKEQARILSESLGIAAHPRNLPRTLSVGERQRAAIARAMVKQPVVLLADEPTAALDPVTSRKVFKLLLSTAAEHDAAVLVVSHDLALLDEMRLPCWTLESAHVSGLVETQLRSPKPVRHRPSAGSEAGALW